MSSEETRPALLARYLLAHQPLSIQRRLREDPSFVARFGPSTRRVLTIGKVGPIESWDLVRAARRLLAGQGDQQIVDIEGHELLVTTGQGSVVLTYTEGEANPPAARSDLLLVFSPQKEERVHTLERLLARFGPTGPDFSMLRRAAEERPLDEQECAQLIAEAAGGVAALQARAAAAIAGDRVTLDDVVPASLVYYERFCGPDPGDVAPEDYLGHILPSYRKELLRRDFARGLHICLLGSLRHDLMPAAWTQRLSDDDMWSALMACEPQRDPFSLLGALDIALVRQHDGRYRGFADEAILKLAQDDFLRPDGIDVYDLLPLFAHLALDRLNTVEGGPARAPYWKRMCAWMQGGVLQRLTWGVALDLEAIRKWIHGNRTAASVYAELLDLHREPMFRATEMSADALRCEVVGRLMALRSHHEAAGHAVPRSAEITAAMHRLVDRGLPLCWAMPGPLEGHLRPAEDLPEAEATKAEEEFLRDPGGSVWSMLAYLSQRFALGNRVLARAREACASINLRRHETDRDKCLGRLTDGCLIAATERHVELSRAIVAAVMVGAHKAQSAREALEILRILLIASTAFENEDRWATWLEEQLVEVAARLPNGEALSAFFDHLGELKRVLPLTLGIHARAEALASASN